MKHDDFLREIERLSNVYGKNKYPKERADAIYSLVGFIDADEFRNQVTQFIGQSDKAPMLSDFQEAFRSKLHDRKEQLKEQFVKDLSDCLHCGNSGVLSLICKTTGNSFSFQCNCPRGKMLYPNFPKTYPGIDEKFTTYRKFDSKSVDYSKIRQQFQNNAASLKNNLKFDL